MARPKTKGPTITLRLSLDAQAVLEYRAARRGLTTRDWLIEHLEAELVPPRAGTSRSSEVEPNFKGGKR